MKKVKIVSAILALSLVVGLMSGCSGNTSSSAAQTNSKSSASASPTKLLILTGADQPEQPGAQAVWDEIAKRTASTLNVQIEVRSYAWADYKDQVNRMAAAGDSFDIYLNFQGDLPGDVSRKQCIPLDDLINKYGADLKKMTPTDLFGDVTVNNKIYGVPSNYPFVGATCTLIRKDLREKYGIGEIKTLADFEKYLAAIKKNESSMSGFVGRGAAGGADFDQAFGPVTMGIGADMATFGKIDPSVKPYKVENAFTMDSTKKQVEWFRKAYANGWVPKDILTITDPNTLFVSGKAAAYTTDMYTAASLAPTLRQNIKGAEIESFSFTDFSKPLTRLSKVNNFASISSTSKNPEKAVEFLNWLRASKDNYDLYMLGIKGTDWEPVSDTTYKLPASVDAANRKYNPSPWWCKSMQYDRLLENAEPSFLNIYNKVAKSTFTTPDLTYFTFDSTPVKTEWTQVQTAYKELWTPISQGIDASDQSYNAAVKKMNDLGLQKILDEAQRQLDDWAAKKSSSK